MGGASRPTILLADEAAPLREKTGRLLREAGYEVVTLSTAREALERHRAAAADLLILDVGFPSLDGVDVVKAVRAQAREGYVPIMLMSARQSAELTAQGLRAGADDLVQKSIEAVELLARVEALLRIGHRQQKLQVTVRALESGLVIDPATGLYNERFFRRRLDEEFARAELHEDPLALLLLELEGGGEQDALLRDCSSLLCKLGIGEVVGRLGERQLALLLPQTRFAGTLPVARRVQASGRKRKAEISIGAAFFPSKHVAAAEDLLRTASSALILAREEGAGCMCLMQHQSYLYRPELE